MEVSPRIPFYRLINQNGPLPHPSDPSAMKESQVPPYGVCQKGTWGSSFLRERVTLRHHGKQNLKLKNPREKKSKESERVDPARARRCWQTETRLGLSAALHQIA